LIAFLYVAGNPSLTISFPFSIPTFELRYEAVGEVDSQLETAVHRKLTPADAKKADLKPLTLDEKKFRYLLNEDAMATEKTAEGIRKFAADIAKLEKFVATKTDG
jgi:transaldolase